MYRLLFGYPRRWCSSARLCTPRWPAKNSSSSTVRRADLTAPTPPASAASGAASRSTTNLEPSVHPAGQAERVVLGELGRQQPGRGVLVHDRAQEPADRRRADGGVPGERGGRPRAAVVLRPADRDAGRVPVPHEPAGPLAQARGHPVGERAWPALVSSTVDGRGQAAGYLVQRGG